MILVYEDANAHPRASKLAREVASFDRKILGESFFSFHASIFLTVTDGIDGPLQCQCCTL